MKTNRQIIEGFMNSDKVAYQNAQQDLIKADDTLHDKSTSMLLPPKELLPFIKKAINAALVCLKLAQENNDAKGAAQCVDKLKYYKGLFVTVGGM